MADDKHIHSGTDKPEKDEDRSQGMTLTVPDSLREKLPDDFDISEIGSINLQEAEDIASEEVLFLTEGDLIEGLEDFDLMPLSKDDDSMGGAVPGMADRPVQNENLNQPATEPGNSSLSTDEVPDRAVSREPDENDREPVTGSEDRSADAFADITDAVDSLMDDEDLLLDDEGYTAVDRDDQGSEGEIPDGGGKDISPTDDSSHEGHSQEELLLEESPYDDFLYIDHDDELIIFDGETGDAEPLAKPIPEESHEDLSEDIDLFPSRPEELAGQGNNSPEKMEELVELAEELDVQQDNEPQSIEEEVDIDEFALDVDEELLFSDDELLDVSFGSDDEIHDNEPAVQSDARKDFSQEEEPSQIKASQPEEKSPVGMPAEELDHQRDDLSDNSGKEVIQDEDIVYPVDDDLDIDLKFLTDNKISDTVEEDSHEKTDTFIESCTDLDPKGMRDISSERDDVSASKDDPSPAIEETDEHPSFTEDDDFEKVLVMDDDEDDQLLDIDEPQKGASQQTVSDIEDDDLLYLGSELYPEYNNTDGVFWETHPESVDGGGESHVPSQVSQAVDADEEEDILLGDLREGEPERVDISGEKDIVDELEPLSLSDESADSSLDAGEMGEDDSDTIVDDYNLDEVETESQDDLMLSPEDLEEDFLSFNEEDVDGKVEEETEITFTPEENADSSLDIDSDDELKLDDEIPLDIDDHSEEPEKIFHSPDDSSGEAIHDEKEHEVIEDETFHFSPHEIEEDGIPVESLSPVLVNLESDKSSVFIIDDNLVEKEICKTSIPARSKIDEVSSLIPSSIAGKSIILEEGTTEDDWEAIQYLPVESVRGYDDLYLDYVDEEYLYRDEDIDFVHSAIIEEDYSRYIKNIDVFHGLKKNRSVTNAVEILGLTFAETEFIEDKLIGDIYADIDLDEILSLNKGESPSYGAKETIWLLPTPDSLLDSEKASVEEHLSSQKAIVWEESIDDIKVHLEELGIEVKNESVAIVDTIYDITDNIVILDEPDDVERFVEEFPKGQQDDLGKLLKYLDGLFEKLPESTIKKFAESEYFDLYVNIMNELGV